MKPACAFAASRTGTLVGGRRGRALNLVAGLLLIGVGLALAFTV